LYNAGIDKGIGSLSHQVEFASILREVGEHVCNPCKISLTPAKMGIAIISGSVYGLFCLYSGFNFKRESFI